MYANNEKIIMSYAIQLTEQNIGEFYISNGLATSSPPIFFSWGDFLAIYFHVKLSENIPHLCFLFNLYVQAD
jgi:hypothetical protein